MVESWVFIDPSGEPRPLVEIGAFPEIEPIVLPRRARRLKGKLSVKRNYSWIGVDRCGNKGFVTDPPVVTENIHRHGYMRFAENEYASAIPGLYWAHRSRGGMFGAIRARSSPIKSVPYGMCVTTFYRRRIGESTSTNLTQLIPQSGTNLISWLQSFPSWSTGPTPALVISNEPRNYNFCKRDAIQAINSGDARRLTYHGQGFMISDYPPDKASDGRRAWWARHKPVLLNPGGFTITRFENTPNETTVPLTLNSVNNSFVNGAPSDATTTYLGLQGGTDYTESLVRPSAVLAHKPYTLDPMTSATYASQKPVWEAQLYDLETDPMSDYLGECYARKILHKILGEYDHYGPTNSERYADLSKRPVDEAPYWNGSQWVTRGWHDGYLSSDPTSLLNTDAAYFATDWFRTHSFDPTPYLASKPTNLHSAKPMLVVKNDKRRAFRLAWNHRFAHALADNEQIGIHFGSAGQGAVIFDYQWLVNLHGESAARDFQVLFNHGLYVLSIAKVKRAIRRWLKTLIVDEDGLPVLEDSDIRLGANTFSLDLFDWLHHRSWVLPTTVFSRSHNPSAGLYLWTPGDASTNAQALALPNPATATTQQLLHWAYNYNLWCHYQFIESHYEITAENQIWTYEPPAMGCPHERGVWELMRLALVMNRHERGYWNELWSAMNSHTGLRRLHIAVRYGKMVTMRSNPLTDGHQPMSASNINLEEYFSYSIYNRAMMRHLLQRIWSATPHDLVVPGVPNGVSGSPTFAPISNARPAGDWTYNGKTYPALGKLLTIGEHYFDHPNYPNLNGAYSQRGDRSMGAVWFDKSVHFAIAHHSNRAPAEHYHPVWSIPYGLLGDRAGQYGLSV